MVGDVRKQPRVAVDENGSGARVAWKVCKVRAGRGHKTERTARVDVPFLLRRRHRIT
jgi:hypothetical protein